MGDEKLEANEWRHNSTILESILAAPEMKNKRMSSLSKGGDLTDFIQSVISEQQQVKDPFYILDLGVTLSLMERWNCCFPNIRPFYAVKCNPDPCLLATLAALGAGFDCSSPTEIDTVLALGLSPDRIIYANPCKAEASIKYADKMGVSLTTFDSLCELDKIRRCHPKSKLLLRLKPPMEDAQFPLGSKFGALKEEVIPLLRAAQESSLDVIGVEFHVGSGATKPEPYRSAIAAAKQVFDTALTLGLPRMHVLDIGGGFKACTGIFYDVVHTINGALRDFFSGESDLTVIAEPGRFFAETSFTLATNIIGKRVRNDLREYWIDDGTFGSMNCILNCGETLPAPIVVKYWNKHGDLTCNEEEVITYPSTVFGPTCDAADTILRGCQLPELQVNDWLVFPNMGAYRASCGSDFNGFNTSAIPTHLVYSNPTTIVSRGG